MMSKTRATFADLWSDYLFFRINVVLAGVGLFSLLFR